MRGRGLLLQKPARVVAVFKRGTRAHHNGIELGRHGRIRSNLWSYGESTLSKERQKELELHPTVKPLPLVADAILDASRRDDIVLDPFGGSGTTLLAAEQTSRRAHLIEIDPVYCDVILRRFHEATGLEPVHSDGTAFSERERLVRTDEDITLGRAKDHVSSDRRKILQEHLEEGNRLYDHSYETFDPDMCQAADKEANAMISAAFRA